MASLKAPKKITLVTGAAPVNGENTPQPFALVGPVPAANVPLATTAVAGAVKKAAAVTDSTVANASDLATAIALVNDLKAKLNALLASQRTAGQI